MTLTLLIAATISTGLVAGLFYGFACAVMPGLRQVDDASFVTVFRAINRRILNGWFLIAFLGSPVLIVATGVAQFVVGGPQPWVPLAAAAALTVISSAITGAGQRAAEQRARRCRVGRPDPGAGGVRDPLAPGQHRQVGGVDRGLRRSGLGDRDQLSRTTASAAADSRAASSTVAVATASFGSTGGGPSPAIARATAG